MFFSSSPPHLFANTSLMDTRRNCQVERHVQASKWRYRKPDLVTVDRKLKKARTRILVLAFQIDIGSILKSKALIIHQSSSPDSSGLLSRFTSATVSPTSQRYRHQGSDITVLILRFSAWRLDIPWPFIWWRRALRCSQYDKSEATGTFASACFMVLSLVIW